MFLIHLPHNSPFWRLSLKYLLQNALAVHQIPTTPSTFSFQKLYLCWTLTPIKSTLLSAICQWAFSKAIKQGHWQTRAKTQCTSVWASTKSIPRDITRAEILYDSSASLASASYQSWHSVLALHLFPSVSFDKENFIHLFASFNTRVKMLRGHNECKPCDVVWNK